MTEPDIKLQKWTKAITKPKMCFFYYNTHENQFKTEPN